MNLTRQPLLKHAHNFFRFTRGQLSNVRTIQHNRGDTICKESMSSNTEQEANPSVLTPVRTSMLSVLLPSEDWSVS